MASSDQLLQLLAKQQAAPAETAAFSVGNVSTVLGGLANIAGVAANKGAVGQSLVSSGLALRGQERKRAETQKANQIAQTRMSGLAQSATELGILNADDAKRVQFLPNIAAVSKYITKRVGDKENREAAEKLLGNRELLGLLTGNDELLMDAIGNMPPKRALDMIESLTSGAAKKSSKNADIASLANVKNIQDFLTSKSEKLQLAMNNGQTFAAAIFDILGPKEAQNLIDNHDEAMVRFPWLKERMTQKGITSIFSGADIPQGVLEESELVIDRGQAQPAPQQAQQPQQLEAIFAQIQQISGSDTTLGERMSAQFLQKFGRELTPQELLTAIKKRAGIN